MQPVWENIQTEAASGYALQALPRSQLCAHCLCVQQVQQDLHPQSTSELTFGTAAGVNIEWKHVNNYVLNRTPCCVMLRTAWEMLRTKTELQLPKKVVGAGRERCSPGRMMMMTTTQVLLNMPPWVLFETGESVGICYCLSWRHSWHEQLCATYHILF